MIELCRILSVVLGLPFLCYLLVQCRRETQREECKARHESWASIMDIQDEVPQ